MPRINPVQRATKVIDAERAVDSETGEVLDAEVLDETSPTALTPADPVELAPVGGRPPTELEAVLQWGAYQVPLTVEERRLYLIAQSGVYRSVRTLAQALTLSGVARAIGLTEHEAFSGIYILQGQATMSAHLIGALVQRSKRYSYRIVEMTHQRCEMVWFHDGEEVGRSEFTIEQAQRNGWLSGKRGPWLTAPDEMLRNRTLTKGARTYCPELFVGGVYTPDEIEEASTDA